MAKKSIPPWSYEDNPFSRFGIICTDMLKSPQFQSLSNPAKLLYLTMTAHAREEKAIECLHNAIMELDALLGLNTPKVDIDRIVYQSDFKYFVFPKKQYVKYGYDIFRELLGLYKDCKESNNFFGYLGKYDVINNLSLPSYLSKEME